MYAQIAAYISSRRKNVQVLEYWGTILNSTWHCRGLQLVLLESSCQDLKRSFSLAFWGHVLSSFGHMSFRVLEGCWSAGLRKFVDQPFADGGWSSIVCLFCVGLVPCREKKRRLQGSWRFTYPKSDILVDFFSHQLMKQVSCCTV